MRTWNGCKYTHTLGEMICAFKGNPKYTPGNGHSYVSFWYKPEMLKCLIEDKSFKKSLMKICFGQNIEIKRLAPINFVAQFKYRVYYNLNNSLEHLRIKYPLFLTPFDEKFQKELDIINSKKFNHVWTKILSENFSISSVNNLTYSYLVDSNGKYRRIKFSRKIVEAILYWCEAKLLLNRLNSEINNTLMHEL